MPLTVDANGGWQFSDAVKMCQWLEEKGVIYVEQPLSVGQERDLIDLYQKSPNISKIIPNGVKVAIGRVYMKNAVKSFNTRLQIQMTHLHIYT